MSRPYYPKKVCPQRILAEARRLLDLGTFPPDEEENLVNTITELEDLEKRLPNMV